MNEGRAQILPRSSEELGRLMQRARDQAIEECAQKVEDLKFRHSPIIADRLRALKDKYD